MCGHGTLCLFTHLLESGKLNLENQESHDIGINTILRHVRYVSDLVGSEHIGFGFDYTPDIDADIGVILRSRPDYWSAGQQYDTPGIKHAGAGQLLQIIDDLSDSGFEESEIRGFLGENFRRVAASAWQGVAKSQDENPHTG